ncbi:biotin/lipoyl-containing protein [Aestuariivivens insulae]|uniref:biotin/lipoyl-containing protein n=1 Tax=Aestuariivivens insulae TaxID=1621988 RepID=UPI001F55DE7B|nr:biotin/lipoyl-containing protein [Aestuariivivens insulae]
MDYKVKVNHSITFELTKNAVMGLDAVNSSPNKYHIIHNNKSYFADIIKRDFNSKTYTVAINNTRYTVEIKNQLDALIDEMGFAIGSKKLVSEIKAPMPGLILDMAVQVGQRVKEGDLLLILEAMKMENSITSPIEGVIKSINATNGDSVEKNQLLIEFE